MNLTRMSRTMSYLLRHEKGFFGQDGFVAVDKLIKRMQEKYPDFSTEILEKIVRTDPKGRYAFDGRKQHIRAVQGHSVPVDLSLEPAVPPDRLYHGTSVSVRSSIMCEGITKQSRQYVHLSKDVPTATAVGMRHAHRWDRLMILQVDAGRMFRDGYLFFRAENGVWLTDRVPPPYIRDMDD